MNKILNNQWTPREDDLFRRMAEANTRPELIAAKLNRSVHAIKARAQGSVSASADQINWVLTSYIVAGAIMTPPSGACQLEQPM